MNLVFIPEVLTRNRLAMRDVVAQLPLARHQRTILVHEGSSKAPEVNFYVSKKLSAELSEQMYTNMPIMPSMRGMVRQNEANRLEVREGLIKELFQNLSALVMPCIVAQGDESKGFSANAVAVPSSSFLLALRNSLPIANMVVLTLNPNSALVQSPVFVHQENEQHQLLALFPEEADTIRMAVELRPAVICSPAQLSGVLLKGVSTIN